MQKSFADLGVSKAVSAALAKRGINGPFAVQTLAIPDAIAGRDVLVRSQTGSGKTLAFAIPIVERIDASHKRPSALILVPTRELASQVAAELRDVAAARGMKVAVAYGGVSIKEQAMKAAKAHIVVATPGRLEDLAQRRLISLSDIEILVLDEADRMLDMGFQPQVDRLVDRIPGERQTMFFSATLDGEVGRLARSYTQDAILHEVESPKQTVEDVEHRFIPVAGVEKADTLANLLKEEGGIPTLVFVRTKRGVDRLVDRLTSRGVDATGMHGDMSQAARERSLKRFATGKVSALIATDVAARGLDLDTIERVVNYDPPEDDKSYVHRVGRTGRAGRSGMGITFVAPDQQGDVGRMAARLELHEEYSQENLVIPPPRVVYSSRKRGRRALLGGGQRRRRI